MDRRWVMTAAIVLGILVLLAAPPYFALDLASSGLRHASLGHHWRWSVPSTDDACERLLEASPVAARPVLTCPPQPARRPDLLVRVNTVRLGAEMLGVLAAGWVLVRAGTPGHR